MATLKERDQPIATIAGGVAGGLLGRHDEALAPGSPRCAWLVHRAIEVARQIVEFIEAEAE